MKTKLFILAFFTTFMFKSFGQNNPVENLTWSQSYENMQNFFQLNWEEPLQPHNELLGYAIYRNGELYRFQTERTLYNLYTPVYGFVSNCGADFLLYNNNQEPYSSGFDVHVTAVYNPGPTESGYLQTVRSTRAALTTGNFISEKAMLFPNPTHGLLNIGNSHLEKIIVYDISGQVIREFAPNSQIDVSNISKGLYFIQLFSERGTIVDKIVIE